tara:strand:+ start:901 stop:2139 length:1239 start_codon:yes stop_codon:yes gene_type:complete
MNIEVTPENINAFLHFGWLPRTDLSPPIPEIWIPDSPSNHSYEPREGGTLLRNAILESCANHKELVVPLSGGLDSRVIAAVLREHNIDFLAVTLGTPGTYDYDLGASTAKALGIPHNAIDVTKLILDTDNLVSTAQRINDWTNIIEVQYNLHINNTYPDAKIVSGFLGDFLGGSYTGIDHSSWNHAVTDFIKLSKISSCLPSTRIDIETQLLLDLKTPQEKNLTYYEELTMRTRHTCSLRPTVFPDDYNYILPFLNQQWVEYMLGASRELRIRSRHYRDILHTNWPKAFALPAKNFNGGTIKDSIRKRKYHAQKNRVRSKLHRTFPDVATTFMGIDPHQNYTDFRKQIIHNRGFRNIIQRNVLDLSERNIVSDINITDLYKKCFDHKTRPNYIEANTLLNLTNLEINLKATI